MRFLSRGIFAAVAVLCIVRPVRAQDLSPRAYLITPVHSNAVTVIYSFFSGNLIFDSAVPITDATATANVTMLSYAHSLRFFGRSANFLAVVPYGVGNFQGNVFGSQTNTHRSGLLACAVRFSVNLRGGPAMDLEEFRKWRQKTLVGLSLKVVPPTGQYDPMKLINFGTNRWAFKPEIGLSRRRGNWVLDTYGAVWFFTTNQEFFSRNQFNPGVLAQSQSPIGAFEGHLSYDVKRQLWASLDGNFWFGGATSLNGKQNPLTVNRNSRIGGTVSVPLSKHQSLKFSYSNGAYVRYGGNFQNVSAAWQYSWLGKPN